MRKLAVLAMQSEDLNFTDNKWPESFRFPFGEWIKQLIFWAVNNPVTSWIGEAVELPFRAMFDLIMSEKVGRDSIETIPWIWLVVAVFLAASWTRNTRVGLACALMLSVCGFLGAEYWTETAKTIGMILVSVTLCAIVGIPLGILSGRFDGVWNVVRPTLDGMQVIHSFVFMLPFIFFFGIGEISATMVTMVFALPPIVRLTNLGIRSVPEDVVEASRAYGAPELRVLTDVQLPLARPAIMTGLNQTLLLAISMLGIAALMGAGGLGRLLYRAINNLNLGLASSAGLAFFLVAVILDRISQTEVDDGAGLFRKIGRAWSYRSDPEALLEASGVTLNAPAPVKEEEPDERPAPVGPRERIGLFIALVGGLVGVVSLFLPWGNDAGLVSSWARRVDEAMPGLSFRGYEASGGSFFGLVVGLFAIAAILSAVRPQISVPESIPRGLLKLQGILLGVMAASIAVIFVLNLLDTDFLFFPSLGLWAFAACVALVVIEAFATGTPRLGADGVLISGLAMLGAAVGYLLLQPSAFVELYSHGVGAYVALAAAAIVTAGGLVSMMTAPYGPRRPLPVAIAWGRIAGVSFAVLLVVFSAFAVGNSERKSEYGWFFDARLESLETPEFLAEIDEIRAEAGDDINKQLAAAQKITNMYNSLQTGDVVVHNGVNDDGPGLGWPSIAISVLALLAALPGAGLLGGGEKRRWQASVLVTGLGLALMAIPIAFIAGIVRVAEPAVLSGVAAFTTMLAGFIIFASGRGVVDEFRRRKVYADVDPIQGRIDAVDTKLADESLDMAEMVSAGAGGASD